MGAHLSVTSKWLLSPRLSVLGTSPGSSIQRMEITLTSVLLDRMASTHIWHGRTQSSHYDRMDKPLYLTYSSEWLWISALISEIEGTNPLTMTKCLSPYIWPTRKNGSLSPGLSFPSNLPGTSIPRMEISSHIWHGRNWILSPWQNGSALITDLLVRMAMDISIHI